MNMDKLKERMGDEEFDAGRALYRRGAVRENQRSADFLTYSVAGAHGFIKIYPNGRMECPCEKSPFCRHTLAALIDANESGALRAMQEMRAKVVEAEAEVPRAMAAALREGKLGVMDYYNMQNVIADTQMRDSIAHPASTSSAAKRENGKA